jgi:uncharacterized Rmd1/YagE family protein
MNSPNDASRPYRFVAVAFKPDFSMPHMPVDYSNTRIITDSKDTKAKNAIGGGLIYAFSFGVLLFIDVNAQERSAEIDNLARHLKIDLSERTVTEEFLVEQIFSEKPRAEFNRLVIDRVTPERLAVLALIVAQSASMEYYEGVVSDYKSRVLEVAKKVAATGSVRMSPRKLNKLVGEALSMRHEVVGVLHMLDKPDIIWEDAVMDKLYEEIRASFDLPDRFQALEYKLQAIQDSLVLLVETVRDSRLYGADVLIIILIVIEVVFALFERFRIFGW